MQAAKPTGGIGVVGVFLPQVWCKGQRIGTGQANVKAYNRRRANLIQAGRATPSMIVSHELTLDQAPEPTTSSTSAKKAGPR